MKPATSSLGSSTTLPFTTMLSRTSDDQSGVVLVAHVVLMETACPTVGSTNMSAMANVNSVIPSASHAKVMVILLIVGILKLNLFFYKILLKS